MQIKEYLERLIPKHKENIQPLFKRKKVNGKLIFEKQKVKYDKNGYLFWDSKNLGTYKRGYLPTN